MMWKKTRIGEFLFAREGKYKPDSTAIGGLKRVEKIDFSGNFHIVQKPSQTDMILIKNGDLVISGINAAKGAMGIYHGNDDVTATIHYSSYTFDETKIEVEYFKRFLKNVEFSRLLQEQAKGGIKTEIKPKHLLSLEIDLPNIKKQKEIVGKIKSIETEDGELKAELTYQQTLIKKLRQQILQEAIEGKLTAEWRKKFPPLPRGRTAKQGRGKYEYASVLLERIISAKNQMIKDKKIKHHKTIPPISDEDKPFPLPPGWVWCRLGDVGLFERGKSKHRPRNDDSLFLNGQYPLVQTGDIAQSKKCSFKINTFSKQYNDKGLSQSRLWKKGTLCITIAANIAETGFLGMDACLPNNVVGFTSLSNDSISKYVKYYIDATRDEIERFAPVTAQKNINLGIINMLSCPLPSLSEQGVIVKKVEKLLALCDQLEIKITENKTHAEQLMQVVLKEVFAQEK